VSIDPSYYRGFSAEQYAADEFFQSWVLNANSETVSFWETYLNLNPAEAEQLQAARILVLKLKSPGIEGASLSADEKAEIRSQIFESLGLDENQENQQYLEAYQEEFRINRRRPMLLAAASVLAVIAVSAFLFIKSSPVTKGSESELAMLVQTTRADETRKILLPDSSLVILNAGSTLKYKENFNAAEKREVFLEGNAFFIVRKKEDKKKFIVHSKSLAVTVLGTEFNVNTRNAATEVGLISGKVKVDAITTNRSEYMVPGEQVTFDSSRNQLKKSLIDVSLYSAWLNNTWTFKQTTMGDVITLLEKYYNIKADFKSPLVRNKRITASIPVQDLDMLALVLSKTVHTPIKHINDRLIIQ